MMMALVPRRDRRTYIRRLCLDHDIPQRRLHHLQTTLGPATYGRHAYSQNVVPAISRLFPGPLLPKSLLRSPFVHLRPAVVRIETVPLHYPLATPTAAQPLLEKPITETLSFQSSSHLLVGRGSTQNLLLVQYAPCSRAWSQYEIGASKFSTSGGP